MEIKDFIDTFGVEPLYIFSAPARVNIIGEHIDYNGGHVLPCAISLYTKALVGKRSDENIRLYSENTKTSVLADLNQLKYDENLGWANYPLGIFYILISRGYHLPFGLDIYYSSNIPLASGLSSSASILDLTAYICNEIYTLELDRKDIAMIALEAERKYNGLNCGVMDQAIIALGKKNTCLYLDTFRFLHRYIPLNLLDYSLVVMKTNKPRVLTESKYNERVEECQKALSLLKKYYIINNLCDLKTRDLPRIEKLLNDDLLYRRVKHCVTEEERVNKFVLALEDNDISELGRLLNESHESLKNDYEVTGLHLDTLCEAARKVAVGARMTGAGFSGCAIALVKTKKIPELSRVVQKEYKEKTGLDAECLTITIVDGPKGELLGY